MMRARPTASEGAKAVGDKSVLLVEDEPLIAYEIESLLRDNGYRVIGMVASLDEAIAAAEGAAADMALLDVNLEGRSIAPVADILRRRGIPYAFVTGYGRNDLPAALGEATLLTKPISSDALLSVVRRLSGA